MHEPTMKLAAIRVQTARMMEIYALLKDELEKNTLLLSSGDTGVQLDTAIDTIRANMRQLLDALISYQEQQDSVDGDKSVEAGELEELLAAVLEWHTANTAGE